MKKYTFFIVVLFYLLMLCVKIAHFTLFVQWRNSKVGLLKCVHLFPFIREPFVVCEFDLFIFLYSSNPQPIGFSGILLAKRQNSFYCTYFLHNRNVADTKSPYPIKRLEVIRWFNQKSMAFNQSLS